MGSTSRRGRASRWRRPAPRPRRRRRSRPPSSSSCATQPRRRRPAGSRSTPGSARRCSRASVLARTPGHRGAIRSPGAPGSRQLVLRPTVALATQVAARLEDARPLAVLGLLAVLRLLVAAVPLVVAAVVSAAAAVVVARLLLRRLNHVLLDRRGRLLVALLLRRGDDRR